MKRLVWNLEEEDVYYCHNKKRELLGSLRFEKVGRKKVWCWYSSDVVFMTESCLQEVIDKIKELRGDDE